MGGEIARSKGEGRGEEGEAGTVRGGRGREREKGSREQSEWEQGAKGV